MRKMDIDQFHNVIMLYLIDIAKSDDYDFSDPENIMFNPEFDDFIRHIKKRPLGKIKFAYMKEDALTKLMFRQLRDKTNNQDEIRIL